MTCYIRQIDLWVSGSSPHTGTGEVSSNGEFENYLHLVDAILGKGQV